MDRRGFLRGGGLFGVMLGAAAVPTVVEKIAVATSPNTGVDRETVAQLESNPMTLHLQAGYGEKHSEAQERMRITNDGGFYFNPQPEYNNTVHVSLKPGPDGELYIKKNGEWKRIVTT